MELRYYFNAFKCFLMKIIFEKKFRTRKLMHSIFEDLAPRSKLPIKIPKNHESTSGGQIRCKIHPNLIFWCLGCLCGQIESYTSLARPFLMIFYYCEVGPILPEFPEIPFSTICEYVTLQEKNQKNLGNHFSHKCFFQNCAFSS